MQPSNARGVRRGRPPVNPMAEQHFFYPHPSQYDPSSQMMWMSTRLHGRQQHPAHPYLVDPRAYPVEDYLYPPFGMQYLPQGRQEALHRNAFGHIPHTLQPQEHTHHPALPPHALPGSRGDTAAHVAAEMLLGLDRSLLGHARPMQYPSPIMPPHKKVKRAENSDTVQSLLDEYIRTHGPGFLDDRGYGSWTETLNPSKPRERMLMEKLLSDLYNNMEEGRFIPEVFSEEGGRTLIKKPEHFDQLVILARYKIAAFTSTKLDDTQSFHTCYDLPALYNRVPGYFTPAFRKTTTMTGCGGGRKVSKGAPFDFQLGEHYFKSRAAVMRYVDAREGRQQEAQI